MSDQSNPGETEVSEDTVGVADTLQEVIHLAAAQVGAEAVAGVVQADQGEVGAPRYQEGSQTVEGGGIVQPAVQSQPGGGRAGPWLGVAPLLGRQVSPGEGQEQLSTQHSAHHQSLCTLHYYTSILYTITRGTDKTEL